MCDRLVGEVGGYLRNAIREPGLTCSVCTGPVASPYLACHRCHRDRAQFGDQLADVVMPLCYGIKGAQSGYLMWMYKHPVTPVRRYRTLLTMLLLATLAKHERCIEGTHNRAIDTWAVVPSTRGRAGQHPVRGVARAARFAYPETILSVNPQSDADERATVADRFIVDDSNAVRAAHVLVIDDTWATGAHSQSAALALKSAGATSVTVLVLARWINPQDHTPTADFIRGTLNRDLRPVHLPGVRWALLAVGSRSGVEPGRHGRAGIPRTGLASPVNLPGTRCVGRCGGGG